MVAHVFQFGTKGCRQSHRDHCCSPVASYLRPLDGGHPRGAALWGASCKYVDIHSTLKLTDLYKNKGIWDERWNDYRIYHIFTKNRLSCILRENVTHSRLSVPSSTFCQWLEEAEPPSGALLSFGLGSWGERLRKVEPPPPAASDPVERNTTKLKGHDHRVLEGCKCVVNEGTGSAHLTVFSPFNL